jgi:uncharacterized protein YecT (DUF1311 family)
MKLFGLVLTSTYLGFTSYCLGDGLDFLNDKHPILSYEEQEFFSECTSEEDTTLRQRECFSMEHDLWEKVSADIDKYVMTNEFGNDPSLTNEQYLLAQEAWKKYVKADCLMQAQVYIGGSLAGVIHLSCHVERVRDRVKELMSVVY